MAVDGGAAKLEMPGVKEEQKHGVAASVASASMSSVGQGRHSSSVRGQDY